MNKAWRILRWLILKLILFAVLVTTAVTVVHLPSHITPVQTEANSRVAEGFRFEGTELVSTVRSELANLIRFQLPQTPAWVEQLHPIAQQRYRAYYEALPRELPRFIRVTLGLVSVAFFASLVLGIGLGTLVSRYGPRWLRLPSWGLTTGLSSIPDVVLAIAIDLGVFFFGKYWGLEWTIKRPGEPLTFEHYLVPGLALTLLAIPLVARVTAAALEEAGAQLYVRSAVARGLHSMQILIRHVGRVALIRVWATVPVIAGLLLSSVPIVEYLTETPGMGREMILQRFNGGVMVLYMVPLITAFMLFSMLSDLGGQLLDPRQSEVQQQKERAGGFRWRSVLQDLADFGRSLKALPAGLVSFFIWLGRSIWQGVLGLPRAVPGMLRAFRDPILLCGTLLVLGMVIVALFAPSLAPFDPNERFKAYQDTTGHIWSPPWEAHGPYLLGSDDLGRDVFSRLLFGTRYSLLLAAIITPIRFGLAAILGLLAAWRRGIWLLLVRWLSSFFIAVPMILLPMMLVPVFNMMVDEKVLATSYPALWFGAIIVALPGIPRLAESVRKQAEEIMAQPYVEGAYAVGAGSGRVLTRYLLPQLSPQLITMFAMEIPVVLATTFTLGYFQIFLGGALTESQSGRIIGAVLPEWGSNMLNAPVIIFLSGHWWKLTPVAAMLVGVLSFTMLGEGLRRRWRSRTGWEWSATD